MFDKKNVKLQTKLTMLVCTVVLISLAVTTYFIGSNSLGHLKLSQEEKLMDIATTMSHTKLIQDGLTNKEPAEAIQSYTRKVQEDTNVQFIVVLDKDRIRQSHPDEKQIGKHFVGGDEDRAYEGRSYTSVAEGTLGEALRSFAPVYVDNELVGVVSVGILTENIQTTISNNIITSLIGIGGGLLIGIIGAFLLARDVKQTLNGLEPVEIAKRLNERDAIVQSVKEGIIAVDEQANIIVANDAAIDFFQQAGLINNPVGQQVDEFIPRFNLKQVLLTKESTFNEEIKLHGFDIVITRIPLILNGNIVGALATFKDKTELTSLVEQLSGAKAYAETLRVQTHEFMNKLHVISAMVHTKAYEELKEYTTYLSDAYQSEIGSVSRLIKDPVIFGFLINKLGKARDAGIHVELTGDTVLPNLSNMEQMDQIITIIGNLFENALEAVIDQENPSIEIVINYVNKQFYFKIQNNGPRFTEQDFEKTSDPGLSTKGENRGYGLYLINKSIDELDGTIEVTSNEDMTTQFHVTIPYEGDIND